MSWWMYAIGAALLLILLHYLWHQRRHVFHVRCLWCRNDHKRLWFMYNAIHEGLYDAPEEE